MKIIVEIRGKQKTVHVEEAHTANERGQHWQAVLDDYEGGDPIGWGDVPEEAIENLKAEIALCEWKGWEPTDN